MATRRIPASGLITASDGTRRCFWCGDYEDYVRYHDREWGRPVKADRRLFEKLCLEGFQSGLSWLTILRKRDHFRRAFADFDFEKVARFNQRSVERLLGDAGIVRHRGKIEAAIENAKRCCDLVDCEGSLAGLVWDHEPDPAARPKRATWARLRKLTETAESRALSRELKSRGFRFVGPTTVYAFMQSMGVVNDHVEGCAMREEVEAARARFRRPRRTKAG